MQNSKKNIGKRQIYNYHIIDGDHNVDKKIPMKLVDSWYPESYTEYEIFILNKMKNLCKGEDGTDIILSVKNLSLLFMTAEWKYDKNGYYENKERIFNRTRSRFDDFKRKGYITGNYECFQVTMTGLEKLEDPITLDSNKQDELQKIIDSLNESEDNSMKRHRELIELLQDLKVDDSKSFSDYLSDTNVIVSMAHNMPEILSNIIKVVRVLTKF